MSQSHSADPGVEEILRLLGRPSCETNNTVFQILENNTRAIDESHRRANETNQTLMDSTDKLVEAITQLM